MLLGVAKPEEYSEKSLCDLWAGSRCHATACLKDGKERCARESKRCKGRGKAVVDKDRSDPIAACAKAVLKGKCGDPEPAECKGVGAP